MPKTKCKVRDKARKKRERAKSRLEKLLCPPQTSKRVQPRWTSTSGWDRTSIKVVQYDADGNPIYEEG